MSDLRLEALDEGRRRSLRAEGAGTKRVDYETVCSVMRPGAGSFKGIPDDPNTLVSPRTYLQDAGFLVVLDGAAHLLEDCANALRRPRWPVYLGRKACVPSRPVLHMLTNRYSSLEEAMVLHPWEPRFVGE